MPRRIIRERMTELTLELDKRASDSIKDLMSHYRVGSKAEIISKAIAILKIACHIDKTEGELFARKGNHETKIIVR